MHGLARSLAAALVLSSALLAAGAGADGPDLNAACLKDPAQCWPPGSERRVEIESHVAAGLEEEDLLHRPGTPPLTGPGTLSNDHLDLAREELVSKHVIAPLIVRRGKSPSAPRQSTIHEERSADGEVWRSVSEAEQEPSSPQSAVPEHRYEHCVESSIRAGNGLDESIRVCRAVSR